MPQAHHALAVTAPDDPVLHHVAPLGLAAAAGTALVVDLDDRAPGYPGPGIDRLLEDGVRRLHLQPGRDGVAVLANGGVEPEQALGLIEAISVGWPAVVVRVREPSPVRIPIVPVLALLPKPLQPPGDRPAVYQQINPGGRLPGPGVKLPPLRRGTIGSLLAGRVEPRWRWVRAWQRVWELPWP